jgi:hypothetical protein
MMFVDTDYEDEAYCIVCGYIEYHANPKKYIPNSFNTPVEKQVDYEI